MPTDIPRILNSCSYARHCLSVSFTDTFAVAVPSMFRTNEPNEPVEPSPTVVCVSAFDVVSIGFREVERYSRRAGSLLTLGMHTTASVAPVIYPMVNGTLPNPRASDIKYESTKPVAWISILSSLFMVRSVKNRIMSLTSRWSQADYLPR